MESIQAIKQRFGIIGNNAGLNRAIEKAMQVAPTDISVLVTGESGVGKESIPKIIHSLSHRKHGKYIAVNCGAIPEGTIDSELFGHEKGAFTGATQTRSGYFEVADNGTIFLDEVGELSEYVGCKIDYDREKGIMKLTQPVLIQSFVDEFELPERKFGTPAAPGSVLVEGHVINEEAHHQFRKGVGKLIHLVSSLPAFCLK